MVGAETYLGTRPIPSTSSMMMTTFLRSHILHWNQPIVCWCLCPCRPPRQEKCKQAKAVDSLKTQLEPAKEMVVFSAMPAAISSRRGFAAPVTDSWHLLVAWITFGPLESEALNSKTCHVLKEGAGSGAWSAY